MPVNPKVNDKWYNIRRFMGEKTQENSQMGYSAAYPTGAERCLVSKPRNTLSERSEGAEAVGRVLKGRPSGREYTKAGIDFSRVEHVETCRIGCESFFVFNAEKAESRRRRGFLDRLHSLSKLLSASLRLCVKN